MMLSRDEGNLQFYVPQPTKGPNLATLYRHTYFKFSAERRNDVLHDPNSEVTAITMAAQRNALTRSLHCLFAFSHLGVQGWFLLP
jgi:hypothetical protein